MAQTKITAYSKKKPVKKSSRSRGPTAGAVDTGMRVYRKKNGTLFTR